MSTWPVLGIYLGYLSTWSTVLDPNPGVHVVIERPYNYHTRVNHTPSDVFKQNAEFSKGMECIIFKTFNRNISETILDQ